MLIKHLLITTYEMYTQHNSGTTALLLPLDFQFMNTNTYLMLFYKWGRTDDFEQKHCWDYFKRVFPLSTQQPHLS
jgi:hypothetical protein